MGPLNAKRGVVSTRSKISNVLGIASLTSHLLENDMKPKEDNMRGLRQYEKDERSNLRKLVEQMNKLYADMGGRTNRPERKAILRAMRVLQMEIERENLEELK